MAELPSIYKLLSAQATLNKRLEHLTKARQYVAEGWTRGEFEKDGRVCAFGALNKAVHGSATASSGVGVLADLFEKYIPGGGIISVWNDRQKSKKPVLAVFDKAIADIQAALDKVNSDIAKTPTVTL